MGCARVNPMSGQVDYDREAGDMPTKPIGVSCNPDLVQAKSRRNGTNCLQKPWESGSLLHAPFGNMSRKERRSSEIAILTPVELQAPSAFEDE